MLDGKLYYLLLVLCWAYALFKGGLPERLGATVITLGSVLSVAAMASRPHSRFLSVEVGVFLIDFACLVAFVLVALWAARFWPIWLAALQLIGTAAHAIKLADPEVVWRAYAFAMAFWSYPMLALIALGTWRHQQRLKRFGADRSWSSSSAPSAPTPGPTP